jgi:hypothetical protein
LLTPRELRTKYTVCTFCQVFEGGGLQGRPTIKWSRRGDQGAYTVKGPAPVAPQLTSGVRLTPDYCAEPHSILRVLGDLMGCSPSPEVGTRPSGSLEAPPGSARGAPRLARRSRALSSTIFRYERADSGIRIVTVPIGDRVDGTATISFAGSAASVRPIARD